MLTALAERLRQSLGIQQKTDIQLAAQILGQRVGQAGAIALGDDCAAIPDGDDYLLLAAEGMWPVLVNAEPWFAGWCAVLVNVSDIYAMGGRPLAVVDTLWSESDAHSKLIWQGMQAASRAFNVPIVGGHTNCHSPYNALSVAILGRAQSLITSFNAQQGDALLLATDFRGQAHPHYPFWDAATQAEPEQLQADLSILPTLAESGLCNAGKDVSMGGIVGTLLMLIEASGCGAVLDLEQVPCPAELDLEKWLVNFPSYGFLLSVRSHHIAAVQALFHQRNLICERIGTVICDRNLILKQQNESVCLWNIAQQPLTGFRRGEE